MGRMTDERAFRLNVPESVLDDLKERPDRVRWPDAFTVVAP